MTDGHEVPSKPQNPHDRYANQILAEIEAGHGHSQRTLATNVGIALGLTNLLVRRLVHKGWIRAIRIKPNRVTYLLTPAGIAEKARWSRVVLQEAVRFYASARNRVGQSLTTLAAEWPPSEAEPFGKRIIFFGTGEVAEIAYVCLQETDLKLVAIVGEATDRPFFGLPVHAVDELAAGAVGTTAFDRLVVTLFDDRNPIRARLEAAGVAPDRTHWL